MVKLVTAYRQFFSMLTGKVIAKKLAKFLTENSKHLYLSSKLHISSFVNDNWNFAFDTENLTEDWFNLKIKQSENAGTYEYSIFIDDEKVFSVENKTPKVWENVRAEFCSSEKWVAKSIASGSYRNLRVESKYTIKELRIFFFSKCGGKFWPDLD